MHCIFLPCRLDLVKFYQHEKLSRRDLFKKKNLSIVVAADPEGSDCAQST